MTISSRYRDNKLRVAILLWRRSGFIPTDLAMELASLGYDVPALEAKHSR